MVLEGLRGYVQIASGLTEVTWQRALAAAKSLVAQGEAGLGQVLPGELRDQVTSVAEDLVATSKANRDLLLGLVGAEVERQVARLGLVSADDLAAATSRAERLETRVRELERQLAAAGSTPSPSGPEPAAGSRPARRRTTPAGGDTPVGTTAVRSPTRRTAARTTASKAGSGEGPAPITGAGT